MNKQPVKPIDSNIPYRIGMATGELTKVLDRKNQWSDVEFLRTIVAEAKRHLDVAEKLLGKE